MSGILVTAFEPFGLSGKFLRRANASLDVADILKSTLHRDCSFLTLPVSGDADIILYKYLNEHKPAGILCLGEDFIRPNAVNIEPFAHSDPSINFFKDAGEKIFSPFATAMTETPDRSGIGIYYCNSLYRTALLWARENGEVPTAFAHIAILGRREEQAKKICPLLDRMKNVIMAQPASNGRATANPEQCSSRPAGQKPDMA